MKTVKLLRAFIIALFLSAVAADAQTMFKFVFKGTAYQKDGNGNIVGIPLTDQTMLADRAARGGVNPNTLAMVYHYGGDDKGDTVEIVSATTGVKQAFQFGFWFGDDRTMSLGRSMVTNSARTEIRSVEQLFTLENSTYTQQNGHGVGCVFLTRRFVRDTNGVTHYTFEGPLQWMVAPEGTNSTKICSGTFIATQPLF